MNPILEERTTSYPILDGMEFTVYPIMPFDAVDLGRLFITHRLLYQDLPFIAGRIFSCQPLSVFTFSKVLNIRIKAI